MTARTRDEIFADMAGAAGMLPQFTSAIDVLSANLAAARANLTLAEEEGDTAMIEDWRLTVKVHKCAVELNLGNQAVLNRAQVRLEHELAEGVTA